MYSRKVKRQTVRIATVLALATIAGLILPAELAQAADRQFLVILANSPKQYPGPDRDPPGQPQGGLADNPDLSPTAIYIQYFDKIPGNEIGSFAEYWEEISYGDVSILGNVTDWIDLPWSIMPPLLDPEDDDPENPPIDDGDAERHSAAQWYDLNRNGFYNYGESETIDNDFARIILDLTGDPLGIDDGPFFVGPGSGHMTTNGAPVWKPGERFVDMDEDGRWDGLDEANNMTDEDGDGHPDLAGPWIDFNDNGQAEYSATCIYLADSDNDGNPDCCPNGPGPDVEGCYRYGGWGNNETVCPATQWDSPQGLIIDCNGNLIPDACDINPDDNPDAAAACAALGWTGYVLPDRDRSGDQLPFTGDPPQPSPDLIPDECQFEEGGLGGGICFDTDALGAVCTPLDPPRIPRQRCEFSNGDFDNEFDIPEPFENFLRRWDPCIIAPEASPPNRLVEQAHWIKVYDPQDPLTATCSDPLYSVDYGDDSYIRDNYPALGKRCAFTGIDCTSDDSLCSEDEPCRSGVDELIAETGGRMIIGSHDPLQKLPPPSCFCPSGRLCFEEEQLVQDGVGLPPGFEYQVTWIPGTKFDPGDWSFVNEGFDIMNLCYIGESVQYDPPDDWIDETTENGPDNTDVFTTKIQLAPDIPGSDRVGYVRNKHTPRPDWHAQAWMDRYSVPNPTFDPSQPESPTNPLTVPADPPPWPTGGENIRQVRPYADPDADNYDPTENRRFFKANAGGTNGDGTGWSGCTNSPLDSEIMFETGNLGVIGFEAFCNHPILPDQVNGINNAPVYFDGWVEHDDLPSSKYHRAGDQYLGEVTSPFNNKIWGHDRGQHIPGAIPHPDGVIPAAGPLATNIDGNDSLDGGNLLTLELLTWRTGPPFTDGVAWENDLNFSPRPRTREHPYAGPSGENLGFRDFNLDGLIDLGESRFGGSNTELGSTDYVPSSESYLEDSNPITANNGSDSNYPFNRRRMMEDCIEALDRVIDFDDWVDQMSLETVVCNWGIQSSDIPIQYQDGGSGTTISPDGLNSGIILLPPDAYGGGGFPGKPRYYPIHNEDYDGSAKAFPPGGAEQIKWNLFFHDLSIRIPTESADEDEPLVRDYMTGYSAREYLRTWQDYPYVYDVDGHTDGAVFNTPIGQFDIMAHAFGKPPLRLVHSIPILKAKSCTEWIEPVDLASILTPGVDTTLTISPYELNRAESSVYFLENEASPGERYYFYSAGMEGTFDERGFPRDGPINGGLPGEGMLILHTDVGSNPDALPPYQTNGTRFYYLIVQADGLGELEAGIFPYGNEGDFWPGSTGATEFTFHTFPSSTWYAENTWTGLDIREITPDGNGSVRFTVNWVPTDLPSLRFITPPGGTSINHEYEIDFDATDVHGGTTIYIYYTQDPDDVSISGANRIGIMDKTTPGTRRLSMDWNLSGISDGQYYLFAKLKPGVGADNQMEIEYTDPRPGRNNQGNGSATVNAVNIDGNRTRFESWTLTCIHATNQEWVVNGTLSQPVPEDMDPNQDPWPHAFTDQQYTSVGGEVTFTIAEGGVAFTVGDSFTFATTGITDTSRGVTVEDHSIRANPTARINTDRLSGPPPLPVQFDAFGSTDPDGQPLTYRWDFGDGSPETTGPEVNHTYVHHGTFTVRLTATNTRSGRFGEAWVDIEVINNSPIARISAEPTSGGERLTVDFSGSRSSDMETDPQDLIYQWDFGDGTTANAGGTPGVLIDTQHFYSHDAGGSMCTATAPCTFIAALTVTDGGGKQDTDTIRIDVGNTAPVANITYFPGPRGSDPHEVIFDASRSSDAEDHALWVEWSWGDGTPNETYRPEGPAGDGKVPHIFHLPADTDTFSYHASAVVTDELGASAAWPGVTITVSQALAGYSDPMASFTVDPDPPLLDEEFEVDGRLSFDRPHGGLPARFAWDWGDGTDAGSGPVATHTYTEPGMKTITLVVFDHEDPPNTGTRSKTVHVLDDEGGLEPSTNRRPNAVINANETTGIAGITEFIFDGRNSSDPDEDDLTYDWNLAGQRLNGPVVARLFDEPGEYRITLTVTDTSSVSDDAAMTITVTSDEDNHAPFAYVGTGPRTGTAPLTLTFNGENSYDPDGDPLTWTWDILRDDGIISSPTGSIISYVFSEEGTYSVILEVSDGRGGVARTEPEIVRVTARIDGDDDDDDVVDPGTGHTVPDSSNQRGGAFCGLGMVMSFFGCMLGLSVMRLTRRRFRI